MTSTKVLSDYTTADVIADMDLEKLTAVLEEASRKRVSRKRAEKLQETARNTFGLKYGIDAFSLELKCMIRQIEHLREQKLLVEKEIQKLVEQANTKLLTIPGVSFVTAGVILGELVDFRKKNSSDPRSLLAFAGLDPRHRQSGASRGTSIMGKRGSPYLRNAIWNAALASLSADPMFRQVYDKQKSLGKHHYVCMSHVAKKLTYVVFSVLKSGKPFKPMLGEARY